VKVGKVSNTVAAEKIFPELVQNPGRSALEIAESQNLIQQSDESALAAFVDSALAAFPEKVAEYRAGKKGLLGLFMGEVMKLSGGKADPKIATRLLRDKLES
jgi:aspartyl-tRNA(Asn)/glutamyl-tRNA(Gln) amidotransferase subunit B